MKLTEREEMTLCGIKVLDEKTRLLPIYFHSVGYFPDQKYVTRPEGLNHYQLAICLRGKGIYKAEGKKYIISRGDMFFFSPSEAHEYYPTEKNWGIIWLVFGGVNVRNLLDYFSLDDVFVKTFDDDMLFERVVGLCNSLFCEYNRDECHTFEHTILMMRVLEAVSGCRDAACSAEDEKEEKCESVAVAIDFIKKNYYRFLTLETVANFAEMSKSHFCREFKKAYGVTPMAYLNSYRVNVAKFLLSTTIETIDVISGKTGFSSTSYFCAVFKKQEGITPMQYREKYSNNLLS